MNLDWGDTESAFRIAAEMEDTDQELAELWWELFEERLDENRGVDRNHAK